MLIELGPFASTDALNWSRFARRLLTEFRVDPADLDGVMTDDMINAWLGLIDRWEAAAGERSEGEFRWSGQLDCEIAEYLLHGLERSMHSTVLQAHTTQEERDRTAPFTLHVVQAFVDALLTEGNCQQHYVDQIRVLIGQGLDH